MYFSDVFMVKNMESPSKSGDSSKNIDIAIEGTPGPPYHCCCGKIFKRKNDYRRHYRVHTGEQPFACHLCGKRFSLKGNLTKHMYVHIIM